jgi:hypothetical protein
MQLIANLKGAFMALSINQHVHHIAGVLIMVCVWYIVHTVRRWNREDLAAREAAYLKRLADHEAYELNKATVWHDGGRVWKG